MIETIQAHLELLHDPARAVAMRAYMRNQFAFLGIPSPLRKAATKQAFTSLGLKSKPLEVGLVKQLWVLPEREYQYVAIEYLHSKTKKLGLADFALLEFLITHKSWWDTVDGLAPLVGILVLRFPSLLEQLDGWAEHPNFWLRRVAMIHQLRFKSETDSNRLFAYALLNAADKEFFVRKAIGWALREYAKVKPYVVQDFILEHPEFSNLTKREALKGLSNPHFS
jgi:3-methyladenine DNA glycosylase AlkD